MTENSSSDKNRDYANERKKHINDALRRAGHTSWSPQLPMTDNQQAFMDRAILATEVILLREAIHQLQAEAQHALRGGTAPSHGASRD